MFAGFTLKNKLIALILGTSVASLCLSSTAFLGYRVVALYEELLKTNRTYSGILANSLVYPLSFNDKLDGERVLEELTWRESVDLVSVYAGDGELFIQYRNPLCREEAVPLPSGTKGQFVSWRHLVHFQPVTFHGERIGTVSLMVNLDQMYGLIWEAFWVISLVLLCSSAMAFLLAGRLQRLISDPILNLARGARQVAENEDYSFQVEDRQSGELGILVEEFNKMLRKIQSRDVALVEAKERLESSSLELVSHRDHLEKLVAERTAHLKCAYEEIRAFVFMFSHDLRTPLVNIKGFTGELRLGLSRLSQLLLEEAEPLDGDELKRLLVEEMPEAMSFIERSASSMDALINAMLKLSFLGRRELSIAFVQVEPLLEGILDKYRAEVETRGIQIQVGSMPSLEVDPTSLEQIFDHIIGNALRYLEPSRPGEIGIRCETRENEMRFHISDNGIGIDAEEIPRVFEPFRRLAGSEVDGQGMGMVYAKTLVNRHGGRIWCTSTPGRGTTFTFSISRNPSLFDAYSPLGT